MASRIWCCLFIYLISFKSVQSVDSPLQYKINYHEFWSIEANWSTTERHSDYSMPYPLVNYTDYADNIDDFIVKYPNVIIETYGQATSPDTFGDIGTGHFGTLKFETLNFKSDDFRRKYIVYYNGNAFWWNAGVEIGIGFKTENKRLYLQCFINGWIYSGGAVWRKVNFGLGVTKITFQPQNNVKSIVNTNSIKPN